MSTNWDAPSLEFRSPIMNAAGSLGYAPDARGPIPLETLGAFVTNPISLRPRRAANPPRMLAFPAGVLLHTGHPNPGLRTVLKTYAGVWARASLPIIVHLLSAKPEDLRRVVLRIEELENILAIELGIEADSAPSTVRDAVRAALGELPLIAQLPLNAAVEMAEVAIEAGAAAVSLGAPRGSLPGLTGKLVSGRLYGPAIFPLALGVVAELSRQKVPVIGAGGVESRAQAETILAAGAIAVQMDIGLWKS